MGVDIAQWVVYCRRMNKQKVASRVWKYTVRSVSDACGVSVFTVRRDARLKRVDMGDLVSVAKYITWRNKG